MTEMEIKLATAITSEIAEMTSRVNDISKKFEHINQTLDHIETRFEEYRSHDRTA
jgi:uncharacterized protein YukE